MSILPMTEDTDVSSDAVPLTDKMWFRILFDGSLIDILGGMTSVGFVALSSEVPELLECIASPPYAAFMVTAPPADGEVYVIAHWARFAEPDSVQEPELVNVPPALLSLHDTVLAGVDAGVALSVTLTPYCTVSPALTDAGFGVTIVVVQSTGWF